MQIIMKMIPLVCIYYGSVGQRDVKFKMLSKIICYQPVIFDCSCKTKNKMF